MINVPDFAATTGLMDYFLSLPESYRNEKTIKLIADAVQHYKNQIELISKTEKKTDILRYLFELIDNEIAKFPPETSVKITCRKGCSHCCNLFVGVEKIEVDLILEYCEKEKISIDLERIREQSNFTEKDYALQKNSACVFLDDKNACKIYEVRPMACRKYLVASDPEFCNAKKYANYMIQKVSGFDIECIASSILTDKCMSLPQVLLDTLKPSVLMVGN